MGEIYLKKLDTLKLIYLKADSFPGGITAVWDKLDITLPSLKGRKFYGTAKMTGGQMEYRACVVPLDENEHNRLGMEEFTIPAGYYTAKKLNDWQNHIPEIRNLFTELNSKFEADTERYNLESYKSSKELIVMLPILEKEIEKF
jgi:predicted transcriptional regulator YdeE